MLADPKGYLC